jgi:hypothetical protein
MRLLRVLQELSYILHGGAELRGRGGYLSDVMLSHLTVKMLRMRVCCWAACGSAAKASFVFAQLMAGGEYMGIE